MSGLGEGSPRDQCGVLNQHLAHLGPEPGSGSPRASHSVGVGPLTSFTNQILEGRGPADGCDTAFPSPQDPGASAQQAEDAVKSPCCLALPLSGDGYNFASDN